MNQSEQATYVNSISSRADNRSVIKTVTEKETKAILDVLLHIQ